MENIDNKINDLQDQENRVSNSTISFLKSFLKFVSWVKSKLKL